MSHHVERAGRTEAALMGYLARERLSYPTVAAVDLGMEPERARERCEDLAEAGFAEAVSPEAVYRITERGEAFLAAHADEAGAPGREPDQIPGQ